MFFTCEADPPTPFTELVKRFHTEGKHMPVPSTAIRGLKMPTNRFYYDLAKSNKGPVTVGMVEEHCEFYSDLFHSTAKINSLSKYQSTAIED